MDGSNRELGPAWETVRRWPGLRGEPKLAWRYLWILCRGRPDAVTASFAAVGDDQGTSSDAGLRHLKTLLEFHLIKAIDKMAGRWTVEVLDPREVCRDRGWTDRGQLEIRFPADTEQAPEMAEPGSGPAEDRTLPRRPADRTTQTSGAEVTSQPRHNRGAQTSETSALALLNKTYTSVPSEPQAPSAEVYERSARGVEVTADPRHNRGDRTTAASDPERPIGSALGGVLGMLARLPGDEDRATAIESLAQRIMRRVAGLRNRPAIRVAQAIVDGSLPEGEILTILGQIDQLTRAGQLRGPAWHYFTACARRQFEKRGLFWPDPQSIARTP